MSSMYGGMIHETRLIDRFVANQNVTFVADQLQIRNLDLAEEFRERIDPEAVRKFGIAHRNVSRQSLIEAVTGK
jgi:hypothetical protein